MRNKRRTGYSFVELAPALWLIFIVFTYPLLVLGTLGVRYAFLSNAARMAASQGAQAKTFQANTSSTDLSAVNTASQVAQRIINSFSGISLQSTTCYIVICPLSGSSVTRQTSPLSSPANTASNAYNFEVVLNAQLQPLVTDGTPLFGSIPGLTGPISTSAKADVFFENVQGLTQ